MKQQLFSSAIRLPVITGTSTSGPGVDAEHSDRHGDRQLEIVARCRKRQRGRLRVIGSQPPASIRVLRKTWPSSSYITLASGGHIIRIRRAAIGIDVFPLTAA
jgi:hypothetical protein